MKNYSDNPERRKELEKVVCPLKKHKGKTLGEVMEKDPSYIDWVSGVEPGPQMMDVTRKWFEAVKEYVQLPIIAKELENL